ncbi:hypothetical protein [Halosimplex pelagicum]|uniref:Uncharacterized protein n=1 Tax=Halosimplex pelagicum TaxID=869886 RepID=A0A7D5PCN2_9EURY|nr:hypothetical protein [Halosimplex pelagicum]QLH82458.1 hypothetical protein HZS54_12910 [Halosimplex pelagicum]QLH82514.1 hypothetical protein HZS54_13215 [Halosimplex pelagicum]
MGDLTVRDEQMIALGEQAEMYLEYQSRQQHQHENSLSRSQYDAEQSRSEWEQQFQ